MNTNSPIRAFDVVRVLAFVGDLGMGQPVDHSMRTAWIADRIAAAEGLGPVERCTVRQASLLRWSGCTATAAGFADMYGDEVAGREAMLALRSEWSAFVEAKGSSMGPAFTPLAQIHCEVSGEVARLLGLDIATETALQHILEAYDGSGAPNHLRADGIPATVFMVSLAGDLEIFSRIYGLDRALRLIEQRSGVSYPAKLVRNLIAAAKDWLGELEQEPDSQLHDLLLTEQMSKATTVELIADINDLKLPWLTGFSRQVAQTATECAARLGLGAGLKTDIYHAGLLHGIGRASTANSIWNVAGPLPASAWEKIRLAPYWTLRAGSQVEALERAAEIASFAYERADGSGYFRGISGTSIPLEGRILATASAWVALRSERPWRAAMPAAKAAALLAKEAQLGRLDPDIVRLVTEFQQTTRSTGPARTHGVLLTVRETEVLRRISRGASNKEVARALQLSPSTVRTHVESVFRKLGCSTRAAATLKASTFGLL